MFLNKLVIINSCGYFTEQYVANQDIME